MARRGRGMHCNRVLRSRAGFSRIQVKLPRCATLTEDVFWDRTAPWNFGHELPGPRPISHRLRPGKQYGTGDWCRRMRCSRPNCAPHTIPVRTRHETPIEDAPNFPFRRRPVPRAGHVQPRRRHRTLPSVSSLVPFGDGTCPYPDGGDRKYRDCTRTLQKVVYHPQPDAGFRTYRYRAGRWTVLPSRWSLVVRRDGRTKLQGRVRDAVRSIEPHACASAGAAI